MGLSKKMSVLRVYAIAIGRFCDFWASSLQFSLMVPIDVLKQLLRMPFTYRFLQICVACSRDMAIHGHRAFARAKARTHIQNFLGAKKVPF